MGIKNAEEAKGEILYGLHFYPGLAQYQEGNEEPYRVYLREETLRSMDPTFAGRPVFVLHVDEIETDINVLRNEADGWVVESFFNEADGKHWAKFVVVSTKGKEAVARGLKLSNCYVPKSLGPGGTWNGIDYKNEITQAVYEHLAIVPNPRYEESVIMSPDEFKKYNEDKKVELIKLANSKDERKPTMKFNFFRRAKVENSADLEGLSVQLPSSKLEVAIAKLINDADEKEMKKEEPVVAAGHHLVDCNGKTMTVNDLVAAHKKMCDDMEEMKKGKEEKEEMKDADDDSAEEMDPAEENDDDDLEHAKKEAPKSEDDKADMKREEPLREEEKKEVKDSKKSNAKEKADKLRNANKDMSLYNASSDTIELGQHQVTRGKELFGSN